VSPRALGLAALLLGVGYASAAQGRVQTGALTQPAGAAGCLLTGAGQGCGPARGIAGARSLAISKDGRNVYVAGSEPPGSLGPGSLGAFARDQRTGALTQLDGAAACFSEDGSGGCTALPALHFVRRVAVSGDGRNVYAVGQRVVVFVRDPTTGALTPLPGEAGCIQSVASNQSSDCAKARLLGGFRQDVAISPDDRNVYVSDDVNGGVAIFARDANSGALSQLPDAQGCLSRDPMQPGAAGCTPARGFGTGPSTGPVAATVSPDGRSVYTAAWIFGEPDNRSAVAILARDPDTGALSQGPGAAACMSNREGGEAGCARARAIGGPSEVTLSPDSRNLYVSTTTLIAGEADLGGEVGVFRRNPTSGKPTQLRGRAGCLRLRASEPGCTSAHLADVAALAISPDGRNAYIADGVTIDFPGRLGAFGRDRSTGALVPLPGRAECLTRSRRSRGCMRVRGLFSPRDVAVSPDGRNVYAATSNGGVITLSRHP
jgi:DNA-binding beta-propeller fold protein YncE